MFANASLSIVLLAIKLIKTMINHKKKILIKKHLGENTPDWVINNCISLLNEYEQIELENYKLKLKNEV